MGRMTLQHGLHFDSRALGLFVSSEVGQDSRSHNGTYRWEATLTVLEFFEWAASLTEAGDAVDQSVHEIHDGYGLAIDQ